MRHFKLSINQQACARGIEQHHKQQLALAKTKIT